MSAQQDFSRLIDASSEIRRPSLIGMEFLDQRPMRMSDLIDARSKQRERRSIDLHASSLKIVA